MCKKGNVTVGHHVAPDQADNTLRWNWGEPHLFDQCRTT